MPRKPQTPGNPNLKKNEALDVANIHLRLVELRLQLLQLQTGRLLAEVGLPKHARPQQVLAEILHEVGDLGLVLQLRKERSDLRRTALHGGWHALCHPSLLETGGDGAWSLLLAYLAFGVRTRYPTQPAQSVYTPSPQKNEALDYSSSNKTGQSNSSDVG